MAEVIKHIRGAGGGKGGGGKVRVPVEAPDSLRSRQYARVVDLISEGEIEGLVNGLRSVYLDDTPVENSDGTRNFTGLTIETRNGTQDQEYIPGFSEVENEVAVSTELTHSTPLVRTITNPNVTAARVTIGIPNLTHQNTTNGDLNGTSVTIAIDIQNNGGGFEECKLRTVPVSLMVSGSTGDTGGREIISAVLTASWTGNTPAEPPSQSWARRNPLPMQTCSYRLEYRLVGAPSWTTAKSGTFSGTGQRYVNVQEGDGDTWVLVPPTDQASVSLTLDEGAYEFRVVLVSGVGSLALSGSATGWTNTDVISGKTTSKYQRSYRLELPPPGPWDIRVRRITPDSNSSALQNATWWDSYTEIIDAKLRYPNSALVALQVDAEQFQSVPRRGYEIYGLKVQIPANYNPWTREYTGEWDGTFQTAWTNNPAWVFYDLVTNDRYGLGEFIDASQVDKWALYEIAQYCDELVPDGFGGQEPRFTCNLYLQTREEAFTVLNSLASVFRGMIYWSAGAITAVQDKPSDPVALFTPANVIDGTFAYQGSSGKKRHTVALVTWNDPDDRYRAKIEYVEDREGIARYGVVQTEIHAVGCTSRGQAHRIGRWLLYSERLETETVSFRAGLDAALVYPGAVIQTQDPARAGVRMGGRIVSATTTEIEIDSPVTIAADQTYELSVVLPDGSIESKAITNPAGETSTLTLESALSDTPLVNAIWVLAASNLVPESWRVVSISEVEPGQVEITALSHRSDKYEAVEQDLILEPLPTSAIGTTPVVSNLQAVEALYPVSPVVVGARVDLSWSGDGVSYIVQWTRDGENPQTVEVSVPNHTILNVEAGEYQFSVRAVNALGNRSQPATITKTIYGLRAVPGDVENFALTASNGQAHLSFSPSTDLDVIVGGSLRVRHTPNTVDPEWNDAIDIATQIPGTATTAVVPLIAGTYLAKWVDSTGNQSENAARITTNAPSVLAMNFVASQAEHPSFEGEKTNTVVASLGLMLDSAETIGEQTENISTWPRLSALGGIASTGSYMFSDYIDLGTVQTSRLTGTLKTHGFDALDLISERPLVSTWPRVSGSLISDVGAEIYVRTTEDDPAGTPTWSDWQLLAIGDYTARAFQFKCDLWTDYETHNVIVLELSVTVDMPDRIESGEDIVSSGTTTITFSKPFMVKPAVGITAQDMEQGDYYRITNKDEGGFDITFYDSGGAIISRTFDYIARAY